MSNQWRVRPSELYGITDKLAAYYFDRAVFFFGKAYEEDVHDVTKNAKNEKQALRAAQVATDRWLRDDDEPATPTPREESESPVKRFRDPAETFAERARANGKL